MSDSESCLMDVMVASDCFPLLDYHSRISVRVGTRDRDIWTSNILLGIVSLCYCRVAYYIVMC